MTEQRPLDEHVSVGVKEPTYEDVGWKNRIEGYAVVDPKSLLANEDNWRTHPMYQREVVGTSLEDIGWVQDVVVNKRTSEEWADNERNIETVLDGHLRVLLALQTDQPLVPIKYVDLTPDEEKTVLLTLDPSSALAGADVPRLKELILNVKPVNESMKNFLTNLAIQHKIKLDEEDVLSSEDEFADFSEYGVDEESNLVDFKFGDYSGKVSQVLYDNFVSKVSDHRDETGEIMLDNVLLSWLRLEEDDSST